MARVLLDNVTKIYDGHVTAVSDFTLEVADGRFAVIVGPSGCGKTTILRIIAGLERADSGDVYIGDARVNDVSPKARDVAMVFQNYALYPHMTVYQNMAFALKMRRIGRAGMDLRVREVAALLGVEQLLGRKPAALSGGQRQRVALGAAMVRSPAVFLFDEPLSNLDPAMRLTMRAELRTLRQRLQAAAVYVTHDQAEAMILGDRICVVREGRIQQVDAPLEVYERPANRFVAGFFGTPPMNFFPGRLEFTEAGAHVLIAPDAVRLPARLSGILGDCGGRDLVLGVRPENLSLSPFSAAPDSSISAAVTALEPHGARTDVHFAASAGRKFTASLDPHIPLKPGETVKVYVDPGGIYLFESGPVGKNLALGLTD
jgi:multiple sugar transport system ATP-binding protein